MNQKHTWRWLALAGALTTGIVITRLFFGHPLEPAEARDSNSDTPAAETAMAPASSPEEPTPGDNAAASSGQAPQSLIQSTPVASTDAAASPDDVLGEFHDWLARYQQASEAPAEARLEAEGEALARQRREAMARLIEENPERALRETIPYGERQQLPASISQYLEQTVSGRGTLGVLGVLAEPGAENPGPGIVRTAQINGTQYRPCAPQRFACARR